MNMAEAYKNLSAGDRALLPFPFYFLAFFSIELTNSNLCAKRFY